MFLSIDGMRDAHNEIRGDTFDTIMDNLQDTDGSDICIYTAINKLNAGDIRDLATLARDHPAINSISFNFHTPYHGTEMLTLSHDETASAVATIGELIDNGYPIFNLRTALDAFLANTWPRPCYQCIVSEAGKSYVCGRCVEVEGLCDQCGYLFAAEFGLIFSGNLRVIFDMYKTYRKYA